MEESKVIVWICDENGWNVAGTIMKAKGEVIQLTYDNKYIADTVEVE